MCDNSDKNSWKSKNDVLILETSFSRLKCWTRKRLRTRLWFTETDRKLASPTESAGQRSGLREHLGAGCLNRWSRAARGAYVTCKEWNLAYTGIRFEMWRLRFNAGGTADIMIVISVPGYWCIPGLFYLESFFPGCWNLKGEELWNL